MSTDEKRNRSDDPDFDLEAAFDEWEGETTAGKGATTDEEKSPPDLAAAKPAVARPAPPPKKAAPPVPRPAVPKPATPTAGAKGRPLYRPPTPGQVGKATPATAPGKKPGTRPAIPRPAPPPSPAAKGAPAKPAIPRPAPPKGGGAQPATPPSKPGVGPKPAPPPRPASPKATGGPKPAPPPRPATPPPPGAPKAPAPPKAPPSGSFADFADFEDDDEATAIGEIPQELISSLKEADTGDHDRPTRPPPPEPDAGSVDLDLDELLDEMEDGGPVAAKAPPSAARTEANDRPAVPRDEDQHERPTREGLPSHLVTSQKAASRPASEPPAPAEADEADDEPDIAVEEVAIDEDELLADLDDFAAPAEEVLVDADGGSLPPEERPTSPPPADLEPMPDLEVEVPAAPSGPSFDDRPTVAPPPAPEVRSDHGAAAAKRTVRYRKPREEHFPLVGRTAEALQARRELLASMAEGAQAGTRARLLVSAAELDEQLGEFDRALEAYRAAREADERDVVALRALRRYAASQGDWGEVAQLLETESGLPLSNEDKAHALMLLAEVQLQHLGDPAAAERHARTASALLKGRAAPLLLLAEACFAQERNTEGYAAIEKAAEAWDDPELQSALQTDAGTGLEQADQAHRARALYQQAAAVDPTAVDARLGVARTSLAAGEVNPAVQALEQAAASLSGPLPEVLHRTAARVLELVGHRPGDAAAELDQARSVLALQLKATVSKAAGEATVHRQAVEEWVAAAGGTDRALGLVALAELRAEEGDLDGADAALKDAALADSKLGTVRLMRELLARKAGDASRLARAVQTPEEGALAAAAKTARDSQALAAERELLARAVGEASSPITADVLGLDAAASANDPAATAEGLRRQAERSTPERRLGSLLALARFFLERGDTDASRTVLREARELFPGDALALRPLSRLMAPDTPREAAALWLEESASTEGARSAFAATWAGRILANGGGDAANAFRRARDAEPGYPPAAWALEPLVRAQDDLVTLEEIHEQLAEVSGDPVEATGRRIRTALLRGERDPQGAVQLLDQARQARPQDAIVSELMLRLAGGTTPDERASLLQASAEHAPPEVARSARLRAAAAWLDADEPQRAAELYAGVLAEHPGDAVAAEAIDRTLLVAGDHDAVRDRLARIADATRDSSAQARIAALDALAQLELQERGDADAAAQWLQALVELAPGHLPSLRALERHAMDRARDDELLAVEERLVAHLGAPEDVAGALRLAIRLRIGREATDGSAADELVLAHADDATPSLWLARRVQGAAAAKGDAGRVAGALQQMRERLDGPNETTSLRLRAAEVIEQTEGAKEAERELAPALDTTPEHAVAAEVLGRLREAAGDWQGAAQAYETAAEATAVPRRQVALWYRAGVVWQDEADDPAKAVAALQRAAEVDVKHRDVFERLRVLLGEQDDMAALSDLVRKRLDAGGDAQALVGLHLAQADLCERLGDRDGAREALRAALALDADRVDALRRLATLCIEEQDWRGATESLIRVARLRQDRDELRWVFFHLGDIYDRHMPDVQRAEQAYRRVLKLAPDDLQALERLADLYRRHDRIDEAVATLRDLVGRDPDQARKRDHQLKVAEVLEAKGDLRAAEGELEAARRQWPTDRAVLAAVAEFYQRQKAESALAMHLGRAVNDLRQAVANDPCDDVAWHSLVEVLRWRDRADAARCCASAAAAFGVLDIELARLLDAHGGVPGAGAAAATPEVEEALAPPLLTPATRRVFALAEEALDKVLPFDVRQARAEKAPRDAAVRKEALEMMQHLGGGDAQVLITDHRPRACIPIGASPVTLLVGRDVVTGASTEESRFLLLRAAKAAQAGFSVAVRSDPGQLALTLAALIRAYDPAYALPGMDGAQLDELSRRVKKAIPRRARDELGPLLLELAGAQGFDATGLGQAALELGNRFALVALGSFPGALAALLATATAQAPGADRAEERVELARGTPEAWALFEFALSDAHFKARERAGADRR